MTDLPYGKATDPAKRHSAALTDGPDRAGARSMLKAVGFTDEDLAKPIVGVATTWIETMPCNLNQRRLGARFDIKAFHDTVLGQGAVSLPALRGVVGAWLDREAPAGLIC